MRWVSASSLEACSLDLTAGGWVGGWVGGCVGRGRGAGSGWGRIMKSLQIENEPPISDGSLQNRARNRCLRVHQLFKFYFVICGWFSKAMWKERVGGAGGRGSSDKLSSAAECALFTSPLRNGDVIEFFGVLSVRGDIGTSIYLHNSSGQKLTKAKGSSLIKENCCAFW